VGIIQIDDARGMGISIWPRPLVVLAPVLTAWPGDHPVTRMPSSTPASF
jgi:hypothetical protein